MNRIAGKDTQPTAVASRILLEAEAASERAFTKRAFFGITLLILAAWYLTG